MHLLYKGDITTILKTLNLLKKKFLEKFEYLERNN